MTLKSESLFSPLFHSFQALNSHHDTNEDLKERKIPPEDKDRENNSSFSPSMEDLSSRMEIFEITTSKEPLTNTPKVHRNHPLNQNLKTASEEENKTNVPRLSRSTTFQENPPIPKEKEEEKIENITGQLS